ITEYLVNISKRRAFWSLNKDILKNTVLTTNTPYFAFGRHLDELHVTWAHLEKKQTRLQSNTKTLEDLYLQSLETASQSIQDIVTTHQAILEDLALYDNESWNDPREFAKPVKAIALPHDVPSTSDCRLIELENQVQCLMEAHLAPTQPTQVSKITTPCEICSGLHDT
ncbi:hypothetical protein Tco_0343974, partial [Tanacetum coccineum]